MIAIMAGTLCVACKNRRVAGDTIDQSISIGGTELKLVAKYDALHIYIYADTVSTNKLPDYAVFERHDPVFLRYNTLSNTIEMNHFENALGVLSTERDNDGRILSRSVHIFDDSETSLKHQFYKDKYTYIDKDGDGLFDIFIEWGTNAVSSTFFTRSNLYWVPVQKNDQ